MTMTTTRTPAQARADQIRDLYRESVRPWRAACILLAEAHDAGDWETLGYESFGDYARLACGIGTATEASKMLQIGLTFSAPKTEGGREPMWDDMPEHDRRDLTMEGLYEASRNVKTGIVASPEEALHDAVVMPVSELIAKRKGVERVPCDCPHCGNHHWRDEGEPQDDIPF